jgi:hypothetical protein
MKFRFLAGVLAAGGILWGILLGGLAFENGVDWASLVLIPGYIITAGYIVRCIYTPQLSWRRVIWGASIFVQGAWLLFYFGGDLYMSLKGENNVYTTQDKIGDIINLMTLWWVFAFAISIYGLRFDKRQAA